MATVPLGKSAKCLWPKAWRNMEFGIHGNAGEEFNAFVGRERELSELRLIASDVRALTLCGAGGIGKTRLAIRLAAELAADFPDGTWFVDLSDLQQPDLVASRIASVIGVLEEPGRPLLATVADALRPRRMLIVLDNCEHLIDACAQVCQRFLASSAGLRMIATSREPLRVAAETVWQVPPMSMPEPDDAQDAELMRSDALRLFADRAAAVRPDFVLGPASLASVAAICRAVDGLPLAIELPASATGSGCSAPRGGWLWPGTARCGPPSTGAMTCCRRRRRSSCGGSPSSPAGRLRWPSTCVPGRTATSWPPATC